MVATSWQGLPTTSTHGDRIQREREEALYDFKIGSHHRHSIRCQRTPEDRTVDSGANIGGYGGDWFEEDW